MAEIMKMTLDLPSMYDQVPNFISGTMIGWLGDSNITDIRRCFFLNNTYKVDTQIFSTAVLFYHGWPDYNNTVDAVMILQDIMSNLPDYFDPQCGELQGHALQIKR